MTEKCEFAMSNQTNIIIIKLSLLIYFTFFFFIFYRKRALFTPEKGQNLCEMGEFREEMMAKQLLNRNKEV
jgi:hypothetical protein